VGYVKGKPLGEGSFGQVTDYAPVRGSGPHVAVKVNKRPDPAEEEFLRNNTATSRAVLGRIVGPNAVAMEKADGDLFDFLGKLSVDEGLMLAKGLLQDAIAIYDSSSKHYIHTDLKVENCLYVDTKDELRVVLADFGGFAPEGKRSFTTTYLPLEFQRAWNEGVLPVSQRVFNYALAVMVLMLISESFASTFKHYRAKLPLFQIIQRTGPTAQSLLDRKVTPAALRALLALAGAETFARGLDALAAVGESCFQKKVGRPAVAAAAAPRNAAVLPDWANQLTKQ
jgi:serine/threonine protein kinase